MFQKLLSLLPVKRILTEDEEIEQYEKYRQKAIKRLEKYFDKPDGLEKFTYEHLSLQEGVIRAVKLDELESGDIRVHIQSEERYMSRYVNGNTRMGIMAVNAGTLLCTGIKQVKDLPYRKGSKINLGIGYKRITFPLNNTCSYFITCEMIISRKL